MLVIWNLNLMNLRFASNEVSGFFFSVFQLIYENE